VRGGGGADCERVATREEEMGRRRRDSGGGEDKARGKEGARVSAAWASGLPNDRTNPPGAEIDAGVRPGVKGDPGRILGSQRGPNGGGGHALDSLSKHTLTLIERTALLAPGRPIRALASDGSVAVRS
jgi:hypothetical protein